MKEEQKIPVKIKKNGKLNNGMVDRIGFIKIPSLRLYQQQNDQNIKDCLTHMADKTLHIENNAIYLYTLENHFFGRTTRIYQLEGIGQNINEKIAEVFDRIKFDNKQEYMIKGNRIVKSSDANNNKKIHRNQKSNPSTSNNNENLLSNDSTIQNNNIDINLQNLMKNDLSNELLNEKTEVVNTNNKLKDIPCSNKDMKNDKENDKENNQENDDNDFSVLLNKNEHRENINKNKLAPKANTYDLYEFENKNKNNLIIESEREIRFI